MSKKTVFLLLIAAALIAVPSCGGKDGETSSGDSEPYLVSSGSVDVYVPEGEEIALLYGWLAMTKSQVKDYFNATEHQISINGIPVAVQSDGYDELEKMEDGYYYQAYWMNIGELPPGAYELVLVMETTKKVFDGWDYYGPDTDYPTQQAVTTITVGGAPAPAAAVVEEQPAPPAAEAEEPSAPPAPAAVQCSISSPFKTEWATSVCETFDSGSTILWTGMQEGTTASVEEGEYVLDNTTKVAHGFSTGFTYPLPVGSARQHMISVDGMMESRFRTCTWGVYVRSTSSELTYFFMINNEGRYTLTGSSKEESKRYLGNVDAGGHNSIIWDGWNNITAVVDGKQMEFFINGEYIMTHEAVNSQNPDFGLIVWGGEGVEVINRFDNLLVRTSN